MWAGVWFPSVALSWLWSLYASYPLCSLKRRNAQYIPLAFTFEKKAFSLMRMYCGKLYANLKMFAGLHLEHIPSESQSYCVFGSGKQVWGNKYHWFEYIKLPNGKKRSWEMNHKDSFFPSCATCGQDISLPTASAEQNSRQDKTALVLLVPWCDYVQPSCSLQLFFQTTVVNHSVY